MKLSNKNGAKKGAEVLSYLQNKDSQVKTMKATTAGVAEGEIKFPQKKEDWTIVPVPWVGRDGRTRDYPAIVCTDSAGQEHGIALSAFRAKDEVQTSDGTTIVCNNLTEFDADYATIWGALQSANKVILHRIVGRRNGRKGRYEFFTAE